MALYDTGPPDIINFVSLAGETDPVTQQPRLKIQLSVNFSNFPQPEIFTLLTDGWYWTSYSSRYPRPISTVTLDRITSDNRLCYIWVTIAAYEKGMLTWTNPATMVVRPFGTHIDPVAPTGPPGTMCRLPDISSLVAYSFGGFVIFLLVIIILIVAHRPR